MWTLLCQYRAVTTEYYRYCTTSQHFLQPVLTVAGLQHSGVLKEEKWGLRGGYRDHQ